MMLFEPKLVPKVSAPMPEVVKAPLPAAMVKLVGSISHVPVWPTGSAEAAAVVTHAASSTRTRAAEVSINPPSPPAGAEASRVPATVVVPAAMPPSRMIFPAW